MRHNHKFLEEIKRYMLTAVIRYTQFCVKKSHFDFSKMLDEKMVSTFFYKRTKGFPSSNQRTISVPYNTRTVILNSTIYKFTDIIRCFFMNCYA